MLRLYRCTDVVSGSPEVSAGAGGGAGAGAGSSRRGNSRNTAYRALPDSDRQLLKQEVALPPNRLLVFRNGRRVRKAQLSLAGMPFHKLNDKQRVGYAAAPWRWGMPVTAMGHSSTLPSLHATHADNAWFCCFLMARRSCLLTSRTSSCPRWCRKYGRNVPHHR